MAASPGNLYCKMRSEAAADALRLAFNAAIAANQEAADLFRSKGGGKLPRATRIGGGADAHADGTTQVPKRAKKQFGLK